MRTVEQTNIRFIKWKEAVFVRKEDLVQYLLDYSSTQTTDIRNDIEYIVRQLNELGRQS